MSFKVNTTNMWSFTLSKGTFSSKPKYSQPSSAQTHSISSKETTDTDESPYTSWCTEQKQLIRIPLSNP